MTDLTLMPPLLTVPGAEDDQARRPTPSESASLVPTDLEVKASMNSGLSEGISCQ